MSVINERDPTRIDSNAETCTSDSLVYRVATTDDCESLVTLINNSYRGELSNQGWTNENGIVSGPRTTIEKIFKIIHDDKQVILMFFGDIDQIFKGCINLLYEPQSKSACLSTFAVRPDFQARGYGKFILSVGENYAMNNWNVDYTELKVLIQRTELMSYYNRRGYRDTGHHQTFSIQQMKAGGALRYDLERCTMRKYIKNNQEKTIG